MVDLEVDNKRAKLFNLALKGVTGGKYGLRLLKSTEIVPAGFDDPRALRQLSDNKTVRFREKIIIQITKNSG